MGSGAAARCPHGAAYAHMFWISLTTNFHSCAPLSPGTGVACRFLLGPPGHVLSVPIWARVPQPQALCECVDVGVGVNGAQAARRRGGMYVRVCARTHGCVGIVRGGAAGTHAHATHTLAPHAPEHVSGDACCGGRGAGPSPAPLRTRACSVVTRLAEAYSELDEKSLQQLFLEVRLGDALPRRLPLSFRVLRRRSGLRHLPPSLPPFLPSSLPPSLPPFRLRSPSPVCTRPRRGSKGEKADEMKRAWLARVEPANAHAGSIGAAKIIGCARGLARARPIFLTAGGVQGGGRCVARA